MAHCLVRLFYRIYILPSLSRKCWNGFPDIPQGWIYDERMAVHWLESGCIGWVVHSLSCQDFHQDLHSGNVSGIQSNISLLSAGHVYILHFDNMGFRGSLWQYIMHEISMKRMDSLGKLAGQRVHADEVTRAMPCRPYNRTADVSMTLRFYTTSMSHLSKSWYNWMQCMVDTQGFRCLSNPANQKTERLMMLGSEFCCWAPHTCQVPSKFDQQYFLVVVIW